MASIRTLELIIYNTCNALQQQCIKSSVVMTSLMYYNALWMLHYRCCQFYNVGSIKNKHCCTKVRMSAMYTCCQHVSDISQQSRAHFERKNLDNMESCVLCRERQVCTMKAHRTASNSVPLRQSFHTEWTEARCQTVMVLNVQSEKNSCLFQSWRQPKEVWDQLFLHSGICLVHTPPHIKLVRWDEIFLEAPGVLRIYN